MAALSQEQQRPVSNIETKRCPVCKTEVFLDMDRCFNCMYQFGSNVELERKVAQDSGAISSEPAEGNRSTTQQDISQSWTSASAPSDEEKHTPKTNALHAGTENYDKESLISRREDSTRMDPTVVENGNRGLFGEFLVEFYGFLGKFLFERHIDVH